EDINTRFQTYLFRARVPISGEDAGVFTLPGMMNKFCEDDERCRLLFPFLLFQSGALLFVLFLSNKSLLDLPALAEEDCSYSSRFENRFKPSHRSSSVKKVNSISILSFLLRPRMKNYPKKLLVGIVELSLEKSEAGPCLVIRIIVLVRSGAAGLGVTCD
ncbi:hypothetical protein HAX54_028715, partial [Datura stramonium]|nr:hypothetical protein [Datura stramonium]